MAVDNGAGQGDAPIMMSGFVQVAVGGALGSVLRYGVGLAVVRLMGPGFPVAVLSINIVGSFLMGLFVVWAEHRGVAHLSPLIMVGLLGGFTTFSAFSLETVTLLERGQIGSAALFIALSVFGAIGALYAGVLLARGMVQ